MAVRAFQDAVDRSPGLAEALRKGAGNDLGANRRNVILTANSGLIRVLLRAPEERVLEAE